MSYRGLANMSVISFVDRGFVPFARHSAGQRRLSAARESRTLTGYATRYNVAHAYEGRIETFTRNCFGDFAGKAIAFLIDHDQSQCLAHAKRGGLTLQSDETGLAFSVDLPAVAAGDRLLDKVRSGERVGMSIGYAAYDYRDVAAGDQTLRIIRGAKLLEISAVWQGAVRPAFVQLDEPGAPPPSLSAIEADRHGTEARLKSCFFRLGEALSA